MADKWQPIETAPRDGRPFFALHADGDYWVCKYDSYGEDLLTSDGARICFITHWMVPEPLDKAVEKLYTRILHPCCHCGKQLAARNLGWLGVNKDTENLEFIHADTRERDCLSWSESEGRTLSNRATVYDGVKAREKYREARG